MSKDTAFYNLKIVEKVQETKDAVTLYFEVPEESKSTFRHEAGQYLTLRFMLKGKDERRSYSLCTRPDSGKHGVTIKRVKGGKVSNHIHDQISVGDVVEVMPPDGRFILKPNPEKKHTYYFFGAGSGITPLMSQISAVLENEPMSKVHLYYGNRNSESIIFKEAFDTLLEEYSEQFTVDHILSKPNKGSGIGSLFRKKKGNVWAGEIGRIASDKIITFIDRYPKRNDESLYYICGPGKMIDHVKSALSDSKIPADSIHTEYFTAADSAKKSNKASSVPGIKSQATVTLRGEKISIEVADQPLLDTLQDAGYDPPYSCTSGACASCMAKVTKGSAKMDLCFALSEDEIEEGFILTCQAHPTSEEIEVTFDV